MQRLQLLLTNDDGIAAEGLEALRIAATTIGDPLIVAPIECHSGGGHRVTTHAAIRLQRDGDRRCAIDGTPADCVRIALDSVAPQTNWVLAGINHGGNLGADVFMSGTVAAVREGVLHGRPGIAVSHYHRKGIDPLDWPRAGRWLVPILRDLVSRPWKSGTFWNVNLPHLSADAADPPVVFCPVDHSPLPLSFEADGDLRRYNGIYHDRPRQPGSDIDVCFSGRISVSLVHLG